MTQQTQGGPIKVAIFEDNDTLREGLRELLGSSDDLRCIGAWGECRTIPPEIADGACDIVIMDIGLPGRSGIEAIREITVRSHAMNVVVWTVYEDEEKIVDAILAGASGYLLKRTEPARLLDALREIHRGGAQMSGAVARKVLSMMQREAPRQRKDYGLSEREKEVLQYLVKGHSYKLIADAMFVSVDTVRSHIKNIYVKLRVHSRSEAVVTALRDRLL